MVRAKIGEAERRLLDASLKTLKNAYTLWGFKVGAAVLAEDCQIYGGCNVESWVSGLGTCAERCAINHAVLHGNLEIKEIALVMADSESEPVPCGACLQYISDFAANSRIKIIMAKAVSGRVLPRTINVKTLEELLPFAYKKRNLV
jgi:cytidine deaminase